jgi:hypothetical protein
MLRSEADSADHSQKWQHILDGAVENSDSVPSCSIEIYSINLLQFIVDGKHFKESLDHG